MKYKNILACIVCCCIFLNLSIFASAKGETTNNTDIVKIESTFTTQQKPFKNKNLKKIINIDEKTYELVNVKYKEIDKKVVKKDKDNIIRYLEYENNIYKVGDIINVDNQDVTITEINYEPKLITDRYSSITHSAVLGFRTDMPQYDKSVEVSYYDKYSKKTINGIASFDNLTYTPPQWQNDVIIPITIEVLNGEYYTFKDINISSKTPLDDMLKNQKDILNLLNLDNEKYRLTKFEFNGGQYKNEKGIICQNVVATGERYVSQYIANYTTGNIPFPNCNGYEITCHYTTTEELDNVFDYTVLSIAEYKEVKNIPLIATTTTLVGGFIIWFFAFNNVLFYVDGKRIYSSKIYKNKVKANKLKKYENKEITIRVKKGYVKRHPNKIINIVVKGQNIATITLPISTKDFTQKI